MTTLEKLKFLSWCNKIIFLKEILSEVTANSKNFIFSIGSSGKVDVMKSLGKKYKVWKYDSGD